jgi:uncharacterized repeat protein (TIGR03803 family)
MGTSFAGGAANLGTIFKLDKDGRGYQTLRNFVNGPNDGVRSRSRLTPGAPGVFYSAALNGGSTGFGVVFQLSIPELARAARSEASEAKR